MCLPSYQIGLPRRATVAGLQHADLVKLTFRLSPMPRRLPVTAVHDKKRVPVPANAAEPYALAKGRAAAGAEWSARRTARALADHAHESKDRLQPFE
jgi:hypothetical protein